MIGEEEGGKGSAVSSDVEEGCEPDEDIGNDALPFSFSSSPSV